MVVREGLGKSPYEAEFEPDLYGRIYEEGWEAVKDENGLAVGYYVRTDNQKRREVRRFDKYKRAEYEKDPQKGLRLILNTGKL